MSGDTGTTLTLYYQAGEWHALPDLKTLEPAAIFHWLDPRPVLPPPANGPIPVLGGGAPDIPDEGLVGELILFREHGALHAVAREGGGWRWFEYSEQQGDGWESIEEVVRAGPSPVLLKDKKRWPEKLQKFEYLYDNRVVAWRLQGWPEAQEQGEAPASETPVGGRTDVG